MAKFASTLADARKAATRSAAGRFTPTHKWEEDETKYIQFFVDFDLDPEDEDGDSGLRTVLMHRFVITGERDDGSKVYNDFISRRDKKLDGPQGYDPIIDRFGYQPSERTIVVACELEPIYGENEKGRRVIEDWAVTEREYKKDDDTVSVPNIAYIIESPYTFYAQMFNLIDMGEDFSSGIYAIRRSGKSTDTTYTFKCVGEALDLSEEYDEFTQQFDLDAWLDELADEDRIHELIDPLPDNAVISKYPPRGKKGEKKVDKKKPATSSRSRRKPVEVEPEDEYDADESNEPVVPEDADSDAEAAEQDVEDKPKTRARRFSELKKPAARR